MTPTSSTSVYPTASDETLRFALRTLGLPVPKDLCDLTEIDMRNRSLNKQIYFLVGTLMENMSTLPSLSTVALQYGSLSSQNYYDFPSVFTNAVMINTTVTSLQLPYLTKPLILSLKSNTTITSLKINGPRLNPRDYNSDLFLISLIGNTTLKSLSLTNYLRISDKSLFNNLLIPSLTSLTLINEPLNTLDFHLAKDLNKMTNLTELNLSRCILDNMWLCLFAQSLGTNSTLTTLDLTWCPLPIVAEPYFTEAFQKNTTLSSVSLTLSPPYNPLVALACQSLTSFNCTHPRRFVEDEVDRLTAAERILREHATGERTLIGISRIPTASQIHQSTVFSIPEDFAFGPLLTNLSLQGIQFPIESQYGFWGKLAHNTTITSAILNDCFCDLDSEKLPEFISTALRINSIITHLDIAENIIQDTVEWIKLVPDFPTLSIARGLEENKTLTNFIADSQIWEEICKLNMQTWKKNFHPILEKRLRNNFTLTDFSPYLSESFANHLDQNTHNSEQKAASLFNLLIGSCRAIW